MIQQLDFLEFQVLLALFDNEQTAEDVYVVLRTSTQSSALFSSQASRSTVYRALGRLVGKGMIVKSARKRSSEYRITPKGSSTVVWHYATITDLSQNANAQAFDRLNAILLVEMGEYDFADDPAWVDDQS